MTLDTINETRTLLLLTPYAFLYFYYKKYVYDAFFIKPRADVQLLFMIYGVSLVFLELFAWGLIFHETPFLVFESFKNSSPSIGIIIGAAAAIIGWLFTTRAQAINSTKANTMKILMESRFSDEYARNLKITSHLFNEISKSKPGACLSVEDFHNLTPQQLHSLNYMLNYFEFIAVGIRCGDLDEQLIKQSLRTIVLTNYKFYKLIIEDKQKKVSSAMENLVALAKRWS